MIRLRAFQRHLLVIAALLLLTVLYYHRLALQNRILVGYDTFTYFYPNEQYAADALRAGKLPLWNPYLFTGVPFLANVQTALFYPFNLIFLIMPVPRAYAYSIVLHAFLAASFTYAFGVVTLRLQTFPAMVAAIVFAFSGFFGALSGHLNQLQASAWLPLLLLIADRAYHRRSLPVALIGSLAVAMQFLAGHMQEFYFSMVALALFVAWRAVGDFLNSSHVHSLNTKIAQGEPPLEQSLLRDNSSYGKSAEPLSAEAVPERQPITRELLHGLALVGLMLALGITLTAIQFLPTYELTRESIRAGGLSYEDATHFSLPPWLLLRSLLPAHGDAQPFSEWIGYVGVVALVLAAFALLRSLRQRHTLFFAGLALVGLFLALGQYNPLYPLVYRVLPGLNSFRVPARWLLLYTFGVAMLSGLGAQSLSSAAQVSNRRRLVGILGRLALTLIVPGILLLAAALAPNPKGQHELPSVVTAGLWGAAFLAGLGVVAIGLWRQRAPSGMLAAILVAAELLVAGQGMDANRVNLLEAFSAMRPAVAHLLSDTGVYRVLPFSEGTYDPGDMQQLKSIVGQVLPPDGVYDFIVASKHKETLTPNLPLRFRIPSLDGYDGGVLPLRRYVELKKLLPLATPNTADGRLREQLHTIPDVRLLSWLNVKYVLMDRVRDAWVDGVYYDLGLTRQLQAGGMVDLRNTPSMYATTVGIVSHLNGMAALGDGTPVAQVAVTTRSGAVYTATLRAGKDTSEGLYSSPEGGGRVAHSQARKAESWRGNPNGWDYVTTVRLPEPGYIENIRIIRQGDVGDFVLRGVSVIDEGRHMSYPVVLNNDLVFSYLGDVKIYENRRVLQRAFLVHDVATVATDSDVLTRMQEPTFDATRQAIIAANPSTGELKSLEATTSQSKDSVDIIQYSPEEVRVRTNSANAGLLVLTDSYYPGWTATLDNSSTQVLRADYLFRGIRVPAGNHEIVFRYEPSSLRLGMVISIATLILVLAGLGIAIKRRSTARSR